MSWLELEIQDLLVWYIVFTFTLVRWCLWLVRPRTCHFLRSTSYVGPLTGYPTHNVSSWWDSRTFLWSHCLPLPHLTHVSPQKVVKSSRHGRQNHHCKMKKAKKISTKQLNDWNNGNWKLEVKLDNWNNDWRRPAITIPHPSRELRFKTIGLEYLHGKQLLEEM